ncbi:MAG: M64 family metallo-endopeptidase [Verrucomicrobia bacterium]|nr:M64 family metallo-endopeptidase [Verrucomicrobiota bacterium]
MLLFNRLSDLSAATFDVTVTNDSGAGSFRQSIYDVNTNAGNHIIAFKIPGAGPFTIKPASALPGISNVVLIDGTTQTNYAGSPRVEINGINAGGNVNGIYLTASNCTVRGLAINRFSGDAIRIEGTGGNIIQANFIGTGISGTNAAGNGSGTTGQGGITILSPNNLIGGPDATNRNLISGNNVNGIYLIGNAATANTIQGNYIGTDLSGTNRLSNLTNGIALVNASSNLIGGTVAGARNLISGNGQSGIYFLDNCNGNLIQGNFIGVNLAGTGALSNAADGITFTTVAVGSKNNLIGGTNPAARNIISGNGAVTVNIGRGVIISGPSATGNQIAGNYIGVSSNGLVAIPNGAAGIDLLNTASNLIGGSTVAAGNLISGNGLAGVKIGDNASTARNIVQNNWIGLNATGSNALANARYGIFIQKASTNTIGPGNVIAGNTYSGVLITSNATANLVQGNLIGTDPAGLRRIGNTFSGVQLESFANTIGGTDATNRNLISGNTENGIYLTGLAASNNLIQGNFIGTDVGGTSAISNGIAGIGLATAPANMIGGIVPGARNLISGNSQHGLYLAGSGTVSNIIQGNYIGPNNAGTNALGNGIFYTATTSRGGGIDISASAASNLIGGTNAGAGNLISGNYCDAVAIGDLGTTNNIFQGNLIGTQPDGVSPLENQEHGIDFRTTGGANYNIIGGGAPGAGNVIAYTQEPGVGRGGIRVQNGNVGNLIRGNSIFGHATSVNALGIDLGVNGVTANDGCDADTGGNMLQNYPVLTNILTGGGLTFVQGTLNSIASRTYQLDFYANTVTAASGYGEGQFYLGSTNVTTDGSCGGSFTFVLPATNVPGQYLTATATDTTNNTSEFSASLAVNTPTISVHPRSQNALPGSNVTFTVTAAGSGTLAYQWRTNGIPKPGATATNLTLTAVTGADALNYDVVITNTYGAITSAVAALTVAAPPAISQSPQSQTNVAGTTATFIVAANGSGTLNYQWRTNGSAIAGATATNLTLVNVTTNDALNYDVIVANPYGSVTSAVATLTVVTTPGISQSPQSQTNLLGSNVTFTVTANGTAPLTYQWRTNGVNKSAATSASLALNNITTNDAANYDVVVANAYGSVTSAIAALTVVTAPIILQSPQSQTNLTGSTTTFTVTALGVAPLTYQWRTNGVNKSTATNATLVIPSITTNDARNYDVVVANSYGSVTSAVAALTVVNYTPTLTTLVTNGPASNRINLVLFAEGYQTNELAQFLADATRVATNLLATPPYGEYTNYFNVFAVSVASTESGSDHYTPATVLKNTYFNSAYDSSGIARLITIPPNDRDANAANGTGKIQTLLTNAALFPNQPWAAALLPQITAGNRFVALVVNDATYGGSGQPPDQNNSLALAVTSLGNDPVSGVPALDIVVHESGHTFADLADEYSTTYPGFTPVEKANATALTNRSAIPWNAWISLDTPIPTTDAGYNSFVGLFPGAEYQTNGWYRPRFDCKMNHFGVPFCEVCSEAIVRAINRKVRTIEAFAPATNGNSLTVTGPQAVTFSLTQLQPSTHNLDIQWLTNGVPVPGATGATFSFTPASFTNGNNVLRARVTDGTTLVRTDAGNALSNAVTWNINVALTRLQLLSAAWLTNGQFTFAVSGDAPFGFVIQTSTNLVDWTPLATNSLINGVFNFTNTPGFDKRFYRTIVTP